MCGQFGSLYFARYLCRYQFWQNLWICQLSASSGSVSVCHTYSYLDLICILGTCPSSFSICRHIITFLPFLVVLSSALLHTLFVCCLGNFKELFYSDKAEMKRFVTDWPGGCFILKPHTFWYSAAGNLPLSCRLNGRLIRGSPVRTKHFTSMSTAVDMSPKKNSLPKRAFRRSKRWIWVWMVESYWILNHLVSKNLASIAWRRRPAQPYYLELESRFPGPKCSSEIVGFLEERHRWWSPVHMLYSSGNQGSGVRLWYVDQSQKTYLIGSPITRLVLQHTTRTLGRSAHVYSDVADEVTEVLWVGRSAILSSLASSMTSVFDIRDHKIMGRARTA